MSCPADTSLRATRWALPACLLAAAALGPLTVALARPPHPRHHSGGHAEPRPQPKGEDTRRTEAQLQAIKAEIERVSRQVSEEQVERDRQTRELRNAELAVSHARGDLDAVRRGRADKAARRNALATQRRAREADLAASRTA